MRISDWSSDVCSSDLSIFLYLVDSLIVGRVGAGGVADESGDLAFVMILEENGTPDASTVDSSAEFLVVSYRAIKHDNPDDHDEENPEPGGFNDETVTVSRSEEHTSELQSLMRRSYAVFCLKKKK